MPKLSDTMEEGTIVRWLVADGDVVRRGDAIVEIETDKATMTVEAPTDGMLRTLVAEGETVAIGATIANVGDDGADPPTPGATEPVPAPEPVPQRASPLAPGPLPTPPAIVQPSADEDSGVKASPLARSVAAQLGVDLAALSGTGPGGRIVKSDVQAAHVGAARPPEPPADTAASAPVATPDVAKGRRVPLSRLERTIARRMIESITNAPQYALSRDVDVTRAQDVREQLKRAGPDDTHPSLNDMIVRAVAMATAEHPEWMARFDDDALVVPDGIHVGIAVAVDRGLLVPVIRDADQRSLRDIAVESRRLIGAARDGSATAEDLEGSTVSVSNLGMFGVDAFTAILNPPEPVIVAVGRAIERPVVVDGAIVVRTMLTLTASLDHRSIYGAAGAEFLARVATLVEAPAALIA